MAMPRFAGDEIMAYAAREKAKADNVAAQQERINERQRQRAVAAAYGENFEFWVGYYCCLH